MGHGESGGIGMLATLRAYLPRGNTLDAESFRRRHLLLCWVLGLHIPLLFAFGVWQGFSVASTALEMATPTLSLFCARVAPNRRVKAFFVTAGLVFCSSSLVHLSRGMIEAHFHFFILIGLIALYQDWVPFLWNVVFTVLSHGLGSAVSPTSMFNHHAGVQHPWTWAFIHGVSVLLACIGVVIFWKNTELEQQRNSALALDLKSSELAKAQADAEQRRSTADLLVNLARRNQSLLNRQLSLIAELEQRERQPEALSDLFQLDHLATRIRRNAESLLVLSGDDPPRLWGRPMPLSEVVRAAAAEVEDYRRVDVLVNDHIEVTGRAVADLAHLLAELIENATTFSPPGSAVRVRSHLAPTDWSTFMISIEDMGIGMSPPDLEAANEVLAEPRDIDLRRSTLGFHVVSRLARRYGLEVRLAPTPGGGLTALVTMPNDLATERRSPMPPAHPFVPAEIGPPPAAAMVREPLVATVGAPGAMSGVGVTEMGPLGSLPAAPVAPFEEPPQPPEVPDGQGAYPPPVRALAPGPMQPPVPPRESPTLAPIAPAENPLLTPIPALAGPPPAATVTADTPLGRTVPPPPPPPPPAPPGPTAPAAPPASATDEVAAPAPDAPSTPEEAANGLVRRVPGASIAAALRRGNPAAEAPPVEVLDRDAVRSMLSQFQSSQRAGRAVAEAPIDLRPPGEDDS